MNISTPNVGPLSSVKLILLVETSTGNRYPEKLAKQRKIDRKIRTFINFCMPCKCSFLPQKLKEIKLTHAVVLVFTNLYL